MGSSVVSVFILECTYIWLKVPLSSTQWLQRKHAASKLRSLAPACALWPQIAHMFLQHHTQCSRCSIGSIIPRETRYTRCWAWHSANSFQKEYVGEQCSFYCSCTAGCAVPLHCLTCTIETLHIQLYGWASDNALNALLLSIPCILLNLFVFSIFLHAWIGIVIQGTILCDICLCIMHS